MATPRPTESFFKTAASIAVKYFSVTKSYFWACCLYMAQIWVNIKHIVEQIELDRLEELNGLRTEAKTPQQPSLDDLNQVHANKLRGLSEILKNPVAALQYPDEDVFQTGLEHGDIVQIVGEVTATPCPEQHTSLHQRVVLVLQCEENTQMLCIPLRRRKDRMRGSNTKQKFWKVTQIPQNATEIGSGEQLDDPVPRDHRQAGDIHARPTHPPHTRTRSGIPNLDSNPPTIGRSTRPTNSTNDGTPKQLLILLEEGLELRTGITMDLAEIRRVECRALTFRTIGCMDPGSEKVAVKEVKAVVRSWLDGLVPEEEQTHAGLGRPHKETRPTGKVTRPPGKMGKNVRKHGCEI